MKNTYYVKVSPENLKSDIFEETYSGVTFAVGSDDEHVRWSPGGGLVVKGRIQPRSLVAAAHGFFTVSGGVASWGSSGAERYPQTMTVNRTLAGTYYIGFPASWITNDYTVVVTANQRLVSVGNRTSSGFYIYTYANPPTLSEAGAVNFVVFKADPLQPSGPPTV